MQFPTLRLGVRDLTPTSLRRRLLVGAALVILIAFATAGCSPAHLCGTSARFNRARPSPSKPPEPRQAPPSPGGTASPADSSSS